MTANKLDVIAKANARLQESKAEPFSSLAISINGTPVVPNNPDTVLPDTPVRVCQVLIFFLRYPCIKIWNNF